MHSNILSNLSYMLPDETTVWRIYEETHKVSTWLRSMGILLGVKLTVAAQIPGQQVYAQAPFAVEDTVFGVQGITDAAIIGEQAFLAVHQEGKGGIYHLDLSTEVPSVRLLTTRLNFPFIPGGLGITELENGVFRLMVVNKAQAQHRIESFDWHQESKSLIHIESITKPELNVAEDVAPTGSRSFYATNLIAPETKILRWMKQLLGMRKGNVVYYNGEIAKTIADKLSRPRSLAFDSERKILYVLAGGAKIGRYELNPVGLPIQTAQAPNSTNENVERITIDADGAIWYAAQSRIVKFVKANFAEESGANWKVFRLDWAQRPVVREWEGEGMFKDIVCVAASPKGKAIIGTQKEKFVLTGSYTPIWKLQSIRP